MLVLFRLSGISNLTWLAQEVLREMLLAIVCKKVAVNSHYHFLTWNYFCPSGNFLFLKKSIIYFLSVGQCT